MKNYISKKIDDRKHIVFLQIITGLIEVNYIFISVSAFHLVKYIIFIENIQVIYHIEFKDQIEKKNGLIYGIFLNQKDLKKH